MDALLPAGYTVLIENEHTKLRGQKKKVEIVKHILDGKCSSAEGGMLTLESLYLPFPIRAASEAWWPGRGLTVPAQCALLSHGSHRSQLLMCVLVC